MTWEMVFWVYGFIFLVAAAVRVLGLGSGGSCLDLGPSLWILYMDFWNGFFKKWASS